MRMLRRLGLLSLALGLTVAACDDDDETGPTEERFAATLLRTNEVPDTISAATTTTGSSLMVITGNSANWTITVANLPTGRTVNAAHVHTGAPGVAGPVFVPFPGANLLAGNGTSQATVTLTDTQLSTIRAGPVYVNVHTNVHPGGEIRGPLTRQ
jgi:hypothetical protein